VDPASDFTIYYDGLVLAEGARPIGEPPVFADEDGSRGEWGGLPFQNMLRNGSAENAGFRIRPWVDDLGAQLFPDQVRPSLILTYLLDWNGARWFYKASGLRLLRTFWGMFGWAHVPLLGHKPYRVFLVLTILGLLGVGLWFGIRLRARPVCLPWEALAVLGLLFVGYWGLTLVRSPIFMSLVHIYLPVARNAYPAIIPTALLVCMGWHELLKATVGEFARRMVNRNTPAPVWPRAVPSLAYCILLVALDVYAIWSISNYYWRL
jgi:hypothetical protein